MAQGFTMQQRELVHVTCVQEVERFDETCVLLSTTLGRLRIDGEELHVQKLDVETGQVIIRGKIDAAVYEKQRDVKSLLARMFS
ncbi:MAG: sporulation protein YabP [Clostridia bacterium]|nr:sporulation protein YabP [Clostridia bacterium]